MVCTSRGDNPPRHFKPMTASFITDQIDQELQLIDLQSINGGILPFVLAVETVALILLTDEIVRKETGKTIAGHAIDGLEEMIDDAVEDGGTNGDTNVVEKGS